MRRRPPSWLPPAPFTPSWFALIHISPETGIITRLRALIGHGRHQISFLLANLQNSFNSKCNGDWLRLIKVKLFKMLILHSLLSHLTWLPLRPPMRLGIYQLLTNQIAGNSWDVAPVSPSRDVTPPCHATPRPCVTHHMSRGPGCGGCDSDLIGCLVMTLTSDWLRASCAQTQDMVTIITTSWHISLGHSCIFFSRWKLQIESLRALFSAYNLLSTVMSLVKLQLQSRWSRLLLLGERYPCG